MVLSDQRHPRCFHKLDFDGGDRTLVSLRSCGRKPDQQPCAERSHILHLQNRPQRKHNVYTQHQHRVSKLL